MMLVQTYYCPNVPRVLPTANPQSIRCPLCHNPSTAHGPVAGCSVFCFLYT